MGLCYLYGKSDKWCVIIACRTGSTYVYRPMTVVQRTCHSILNSAMTLFILHEYMEEMFLCTGRMLNVLVCGGCVAM